MVDKSPKNQNIECPFLIQLIQLITKHMKVKWICKYFIAYLSNNKFKIITFRKLNLTLHPKNH